MRENPLGVEAFDFVEFAAPDASLLHELFPKLGFTAVARHKDKNITLYRQGDIDFLVNEEPDSFAADFATKHGPCCTGFALVVKDAAAAHQTVLTQGTEDLSGATGTAVALPCIKGVGGSILYLSDHSQGRPVDSEFVALDGVEQHPKGFGLSFIDHLTHNVYSGNMDEWADYYSRLFNFFEVKYFDIRGAQTGLRSRAMTAPNGVISIPINESSDPKSQINEYLDIYNGEGVQHIALYTEDIYASIEIMHKQGVKFLDTPDTYYEMVDERIPSHGEDLVRMRENRILIDADVNEQDKQLLQIFTQTCIGPIFFEVIQRKGNKGFGEGNFKALFESIERDQQRRGVL